MQIASMYCAAGSEVRAIRRGDPGENALPLSAVVNVRFVPATEIALDVVDVVEKPAAEDAESWLVSCVWLMRPLSRMLVQSQNSSRVSSGGSAIPVPADVLQVSV